MAESLTRDAGSDALEVQLSGEDTASGDERSQSADDVFYFRKLGHLDKR